MRVCCVRVCCRVYVRAARAKRVLHGIMRVLTAQRPPSPFNNTMVSSKVASTSLACVCVACVCATRTKRVLHGMCVCLLYMYAYAVFVCICCVTAFAVCLPLLRIHVLHVLRVCLRVLRVCLRVLRVFVSCAACASLVLHIRALRVCAAS